MTYYDFMQMHLLIELVQSLVLFGVVYYLIKESNHE